MVANKNCGSEFLSEEENEQIFGHLGNRRYSVAAGVVQLISAEPSCPEYWAYNDTGVILLVKDCSRRAYFLRLFDMDEGLLWELKIYDNMSMDQPIEELLTFEGEDRVFGLNFACPKEASNFKFCVEMKSEEHARPGEPEPTLLDSIKPQITPAQPKTWEAVDLVPVENTCPPPPAGNNDTTICESKLGMFRRKLSLIVGGKPEKKLSKALIGQPTDFTHPIHLGWDVGGLSVEGSADNPLVSQFMRLMGGIRNEEEKQIVEDIIEKKGGIDQFQNELKRNAAVCGNGAPPPPPPPLPNGAEGVTPSIATDNPEVKIDFLTQIRERSHKPLTPVVIDTVAPSQEHNSIAEAISMALDERRKQMQGEEDSTDEEMEDKDWENEMSE